MSEPTITCPNCKTEFALNESLAAPLIEATRREFQARLAAKDDAIAERETSIQREKAAIEAARAGIDAEIAKRLDAERMQIAAEESQKAQRTVALDLKAVNDQLADSNRLLAEREAKLAEAQAAQADLLRARRELDDQKREMALTIEKQVQESLGAVRDKAKREAEEGLSLKLREREEVIAGMGRQIEDLKRRAEQGSMQLQGEVLELVLEDMIRERFPRDEVAAVAKGVVALLSIRAQTVKGMLLLIWLWSAVVSMPRDLMVAGFTGVPIPYVAVGLIANVLGGALIAGWVGVALFAFCVVGRALSGAPYSLLVSAGAGVAVGVLTSSAAYYSLRAIHYPLPTSVTALLTPPVQGRFWPGSSYYQTNTKLVEGGRFHVVPGRTQSVRVAAQTYEGPLRIEWKKLIDAQRYDVEFWLVGDCSNQFATMRPGPAHIAVRDIKSFAVGVDSGISTFEVSDKQDRAIGAELSGPAQVKIEKMKDDGSLWVSLRASPTDRLSVFSSEDITFLLDAALLAGDREKLTTAPRTLSIDVDGQQWRARIEPLLLPGGGKRPLTCHPLASSTLAAGRRRPLATAQVNAGIFVRVKAIQPEGVPLYNDPSSSLRVHGGRGSFFVADLSPDSLKGAGGLLHGFEAKGGVSDVEVRRAPIEVKSHVWFGASGDLSAYYEDDGKLKITGHATEVWKDGARLNQTRWESLSTEWRLALVGLFGAMLTGLARITWLSSSHSRPAVAYSPRMRA